jgi:hypothetical protein
VNDRNRLGGQHAALGQWAEEPYLEAQRPEPRWAEDVFRVAPPMRAGQRPGDLVDSLPRRSKAVELPPRDLGRAV